MVSVHVAPCGAGVPCSLDVMGPVRIGVESGVGMGRNVGGSRVPFNWLQPCSPPCWITVGETLTRRPWVPCVRT